MDTNLNPKHRRLFTLAAQLKAGKGLTVGATIVEGQFGAMYGESQAARLALKQVTYTPVLSTLAMFWNRFTRWPCVPSPGPCR